MYMIIAYCFANSFISVICGCLLLAERLFIISRNDTKKIIELLNMLIFATAMPLLAGSKLVIIFLKTRYYGKMDLYGVWLYTSWR